MKVTLRLAVLLSFFGAGSLLTVPQAQTPAAPATAAQPAAPAAPATSKVWIGRYAEFEEFLRTAEIERTTNVGTGILGIKRVYFKPGGLVASAAMRNIRPAKYDGYFESYKGDVAAYRLDRMLELDMVPPTVERRYNNENVSLQLWASNTKMLKDVEEQKIPMPSTTLAWVRQSARQKVFDDLIANIDSNKGNLLFDPLWNFIKVDCSRCFTDTPKLVFEIGTPRGVNLIDRPLFERLKALDRDTVRKEIGDLIAEVGTVTALMARRDAIVKGFEKLAKEKGEAQVFLP